MTTSLKRSSDAMADEPIDPNNHILDVPNYLEARINFINQTSEKVI
jgi:hypothetical protein